MMSACDCSLSAKCDVCFVDLIPWNTLPDLRLQSSLLAPLRLESRIQMVVSRVRE